MTREEAKAEIERLSVELEHHNRRYYEDAAPEISDHEYDQLFRNLELLEDVHPEFASPNSPTQRVGSDVLEGFPQREHEVAMLSIDDVFSEEEVGDFFARLERNLGEMLIPLTIEPKIDGVAVALHYVERELDCAVTRGDGSRGDVITENVRTIRSIPLRLPLESAPKYLEVRGEIFMPNQGFADMNQEREEAGLTTFVNPRNAAAGALKLLDSREVAKRPLDFIAHGIGRYAGEPLANVLGFRALLGELGLPVNNPFWEADTLDGVLRAIRELDEKRHSLDYGTDGAVVKVNSFEWQEQLGATSRAPRWAMAFKYPAEQKETVLREITVQVGRTGTLTPVAELEPVFVSGSTVRRATLHNQDEIDRKDVRKGDTVVIEKAGEIIPAVVRVVKEKRPPNTAPYILYDEVSGKCPSCDFPIERSEGFVAWKCVNFACSAKVANRIKQFVSRKALDIDGIGNIVAEKLVEREWVRDVLDLFRLEEAKLGNFNLGSDEQPRMLGSKNAAKIVSTLHKSRSAPLHRWIYALGIPQVGESAARELARLHNSFEALADSSILAELRTLKTGQKKEDNELLAPYQIASEVGPTVAEKVLEFFQSESGENLLSNLSELNLAPVSENYMPEPVRAEGQSADSSGMPLAGKTVVITGKLSAPRDEIKEKILKLGGKVTGAISKNTDFLLAGEGGGSKRDKAASLGITIISEEELLALPD